ncbi:hypothetical protein BaRGS_00015924, partial [Batillaria attramentaria]
MKLVIRLSKHSLSDSSSIERKRLILKCKARSKRTPVDTRVAASERSAPDVVLSQQLNQRSRRHWEAGKLSSAIQAHPASPLNRPLRGSHSQFPRPPGPGSSVGWGHVTQSETMER